MPTSVTIPGGSTSATFDFVIAADDDLESEEVVRLTLCPTGTCPAGYTSGDTPPSFEVLFRDLGVVTDLSALPDRQGGLKEITEGRSGTFTVRPEIDPVRDVTISPKAIAGYSTNDNVSEILNGTAIPHIAFDADPGMDGFQISLTVTGAPVVFPIVDDETGAVVVPPNWALKPSGLGGGDTFRLIFVTSETRTAESADIDDYNSWVQGVVARGGHANLLSYGGLVTVIGSTTTVDARENTGMWDPDLNSGSGGHADGSTSDSDPGTKVYWLAAPPRHKVADNYHEFHGSSGWDGGTDQSGRDTMESEASRTNNNNVWSGSYTTGTRLWQGDPQSNIGLGGSSVAVGHTNSANVNPLHTSAAASPGGSIPMFGISPMFEVEAPELSFDSGGAFGVAEGGMATVTLSLSIAAPAAATVNYTFTGGTDYTALTGTFPLTSGATAHSFTIVIRLDAGTGYAVGSPDTATVTITDDDKAAPPVLSVTLPSVEEVSRNTAGAAVTIANANTATPSLTFTGHGTDTVMAATVTLTPVANRDDGDTAHEAITATLAPDSVLGSTSGSGTTVGGGAMRHGTNFARSLVLNDDEAPKATVTFSVSDLRLLENGSATYRVVLDQEPTAGMANLEVAKVDANTASCVSDARWSIVAGYYDSNANRPPNYGANWYRVLIAYRRDRGDRTMPAWAGQTAEPATAYTAEEAGREEAVWSGWTPVREVLECLEKTYGTFKSSAIGGIPPPAGPAASPWPTRSGAWSDNPCGRRCRDRSESQPPLPVIPRGVPPPSFRAERRPTPLSFCAQRSGVAESPREAAPWDSATARGMTGRGRHRESPRAIASAALPGRRHGKIRGIRQLRSRHAAPPATHRHPALPDPSGGRLLLRRQDAPDPPAGEPGPPLLPVAPAPLRQEPAA